MNKAKQPSWDKVPWQIVESLLSNILVASYKVHFVAYIIDKKHVSQLILATSTVWKAIYLHYLKAYHEAPFVEETPKDHLWETFKELKHVIQMKKVQNKQCYKWWGVGTPKTHEWTCNPKCIRDTMKFHWLHTHDFNIIS